MWNIKSQALLVLAFASQTLVLGTTVSLAPKITNFICNARGADISWKPHTDGAEVESYKIEYSTSYEPNNWIVVEEKESTESSTTIKMIPGVNYTFRVVSVGKDNALHPSEPSEICSSRADIPYRNPDDVRIISLGPLEMTIKWTPIPQMEHNGPDFHYIVSWRPQDCSSGGYSVELNDWTRDTYVIEFDTFQKYDIQVRSANKIGQAYGRNMQLSEYPGESRPSQAPRKFKVLMDTEDIYGYRASVTFQWERMPNKILNGHRDGYTIKYWEKAYVYSEYSYEEHSVRQTNETTISRLNYDSVYCAQIQATNDRFHGPFSRIIEFRTPKGLPRKVNSFNAVSMGSSIIALNWTKPDEPNGELLRYNIYYEIEGSDSQENRLEITDPNVTETILRGLQPNTTYRLHIAAVSNTGEGEESYIIHNTPSPAKPDTPTFKWKIFITDDSQIVNVVVEWIPKMDSNPGSSFYVNFRLNGEGNWTKTEEKNSTHYIILYGLLRNREYDMAVVSIDGNFEAESEVQTVKTEYIEPPKDEEPSNPPIPTTLIIGIVLIAAGIISVCVFFKIRKKSQDSSRL